MREIKFRAWDKEKKKMIRTLLLTNTNFEISPEYWYRKNCILMQYTSLKDKNRKEIYEEDIVKNPSWEGYFVVKFGKHSINCCGCCYVSHQSIGFYLKPINPSWKTENIFADEDMWDEIEIVGNSYKNPELLKEKP